ncbi:unnamed protein product [Victoria cruziana]
MKSLTLFLIVILFVRDICYSSYGSSDLGNYGASLGDAGNQPPSSSGEAISHLRFLGESSPTKAGSCKNYPFICRLRGSAGPDCCKNSCVNTFTDQRNCSRCGKKCKHGETCCGGECVNLSVNTSHCGQCFNKCSSGDSCSYGLCAYA